MFTYTYKNVYFMNFQILHNSCSGNNEDVLMKKSLTLSSTNNGSLEKV